tara:strand:- start:165345 stop:165686 length:342 start_codon:yes stop_codon:yes gene_type:complete
MKKLITSLLFVTSSFLFASEITCIPDGLNTTFDEVYLTKQSGNRYEVEVVKNKEVLLTSEVRNSFIRRGGINQFQNKSKQVIIKTSRLYPNNSKRALIDIKGYGKYLGYCKLH